MISTFPIFMKTIFFLVLSGIWMAVISTSSAGAQEVPGWENLALQLEPVVIDPEAPPPSPPPEEGEGAAATTPVSNEADAITTDISELAESLGNDVTRIFLWVRNNIRFTHYYGCKKGAALTYFERSGNDADQSALLAALLRAAGHTVRYNAAWCFGSEELWAGYFGVEVGSSGGGAQGYQIWLEAAAAGGMPSGTLVSTNGFETPPRWGLTRYWVEVHDAGNWVRYDPSYKPFSRTEPQVDVGTESGYERTNMLNAAGGTTGTDSVSGVSEASLNTHLFTQAQTLGGHVRTTQPNLSAVDAYGGNHFAPLVPATPEVLAAGERFPWDVPGWATYPMGVNGAEVLPTSFMSTLRLQLSAAKNGAATLDKSFKLPELAGRRLTLEFDGTGATNQAVLRLDDEIVASESVPIAAGASCYLKSTITHPGAANQAPVDAVYLRGASYVLIYGFEAGEHLLRARMGKLAAYKEDGKEENSREVIVESLNVMGLSWLRQTELTERAVLNAADMLKTTHHRFGRMAQDTSFYVDVGQQLSATYRRRAAQSTADGRVLQRAYSFVASAMEHGVLAQTQAGADAVSTVRLVALNNSGAGTQQTYLATRSGGATNWSTVKALLTGYSTADLNTIEAVMTNPATVTGYALLPKNGSITRGNWSGAGYVLDRETQVSPTTTIISVGMLISGSLNGGFNTVPATLSSTIPVDYFYDYGKAFAPSITLQDAFRNMAGDPVNLSTGFFTASSAGLALDSRSLPRGLAFGLSYDGIRRSESAAGVGYGWDFNLNARLTRGSDYESTLGSLSTGTAVQGARLAFGAHALLDLCRNLGTAKDWTVAQLVALWMVDPLVDNVVTVAINGSAHQFIKSADETGWLSPPGSTLMFSPAAESASGKDEVRERHGNVYRFNVEGRLVEVEDPWAKKAVLTYDATGKRLTRVTDAYGRYLELVWDANDRLDYVSDPQSTPARVLDLSYDVDGHLTTVTDPEGKCDRFEYDADHRLIIQRDHDNRTITHNKVFDSQHRVLEQWGQGLESQKWTFRYTPGEVRVTDPANATTVHCYDERGRPCVKVNPLGHAERAEFDGENHTRVRITPLLRESSATFDGEHNVLTSTASSGGTTPAVSTTVNTYDAQNRLKTTTDPRNHVITYGYHGDADGVSDPDAKHLPTRVYHTVEDVLIETSTTYNAAGNVETVTDAAGYVTSFEYDALDRLTYTRLPGPGSHYTQVMSYTAAGDPYQVRDARGNVTTFDYNKRREPTGSVTTATTVDNVTQNIDPAVQYDNNRNAFKAVNSLGRFNTSTFSATGKLLSTQHSALPGVDLVSNTYDDRDLPWTSTNVLGQTTTFTYDDASRVTDADDHLNRNLHTEKDDDDRPLSVRNALNQTNTSQYLDDERKSKSINPMLQAWTLQTDAAGNLTHRTNARNKTWVHAYDEGGRLETTTSPESRVSSVTWNTRGLLASATEPSLQSTTLTYDARGRLDDVTGADYALDHAYDAGGNLLTLTETTTALGARGITRTYDEVNRLKTYTNAEGETLKYIWDENGNLRFLEYPDTSRVEYQYDERDRLQYVKEAGVTMAEFQWTIANQLKKIIRGNGTTRELFYDEANRLGRIEERGPDGRLFYYQRSAFDDGDRMTKRLILPAPGVWNEPADTAVFDGDNWMTSFNGAALTHDADGNLQAAPTRPAGAASGSADESTTFTWDARNRVISATAGATARFYTYSPDGNLTHLRSGSAVAVVGTRFTVNPHGAGGLSQVLVRTDLATNGQTKVIHGLGVLYEKRPDGSLRWLHYDHLGNTVALTDTVGTVTGRASYSLWGMLYQTSGDIESTPFLYNGRFGVLTEQASGCLHMRARWYNPRIRRFLSIDPAGFDGGWNMFAYANGNPLAMIDPFGLGAKSSTSTAGFWSDYHENFMSSSRREVAALTSQVNALNDRNTNYAAYSSAISNVTDNRQDIAKQSWYPVGVGYGQREAYDQAQETKQAVWDSVLLAASFTPLGRIEGTTYQIVDGVRRTVAASLAGRSTIAASVQIEGRILQTINVPISALRSPRPTVDISTSAGLQRWRDVVQGTQSGASLPPIIITPGSKGTSIPNIWIDAGGN
jgi:RHS repeat-associated protein